PTDCHRVHLSPSVVIPASLAATATFLLLRFCAAQTLAIQPLPPFATVLVLRFCVFPPRPAQTFARTAALLLSLFSNLCSGPWSRGLTSHGTPVGHRYALGTASTAGAAFPLSGLRCFPLIRVNLWSCSPVILCSLVR